MANPKRIKSTIIPEKFVNLGNGKWYYNYDIKSEIKKVRNNRVDKESLTETRWSYIQIKLEGKPEYKKCVEKLIRLFITQNEEFDLINSANRGFLNMGTARSIPSEYIDYLNLVDEIKAKVRADFEM